MSIDLEKSISHLDAYLGQTLHVVAFGTSYLGILQKVDLEKGYIILKERHKKDCITLDLDWVESFAVVDHIAGGHETRK